MPRSMMVGKGVKALALGCGPGCADHHRPGRNGVRPPGGATSDAFGRTCTGSGDCHIITRKNPELDTSRARRRELDGGRGGDARSLFQRARSKRGIRKVVDTQADYL